MKVLFAIGAFLIPLGISLLLFPDGFVGLLVCAPIIAVTAAILSKRTEHGDFLVPLFVSAFLVRAVAASVIVGLKLQEFFAEDSVVHELWGYGLSSYWAGQAAKPFVLDNWQNPWGLYYLIGTVYSVIGRNVLAINFLSCLAGALTCVFVYLCAFRVFKNARVAKTAAILIAFFPAMVIWSAQIMKDGFVVFFVVASIYFLIRLQERFSAVTLVCLLAALLGVVSVRFYIFYFSAVACLGSFFLGSQRIVANGLRWLIVICILVTAMAYTGVLTVGQEQVAKLSNLENMQYSRESLSKEAKSGYGADTDITTPTGALLALPIGLTNLLLAPFPWQFSSVRSMLPLPEMIVWWCLFPFLIMGIIFTLRHRFRESIPVVLFTVTLTLAYALFQTNVGTAYRQRTQIQVFLFVFIAVGWQLYRERQEDKKLIRRRREMRLRQAAQPSLR